MSEKKGLTEMRASPSTGIPALTKAKPTDVSIDDSRYKKSGIKEKVLGHVKWED